MALVFPRVSLSSGVVQHHNILTREFILGGTFRADVPQPPVLARESISVSFLPVLFRGPDGGVLIGF